MRSVPRARILLSIIAVLAVGAGARATIATPVVIEVLSNRADLISGGDALVAVDLPAGTNPSSVTVDVDGRDVTNSFGVVADGRFVGLVTGLALGPNVLSVTLPDDTGARITITNHPKGGPVIAGPQIQPWTCAPGALDAQCNRAPVYSYRYKPATGGSLQNYDPANPPPSQFIASTTTDHGVTVPFIVRVETGVLDRDEYRIAVLYEPGKPWTPTQPQPAFNHKLVLTHGASCDTGYAQAAAPDVLNETALARGFAVASHALDNAGHNCNIITQGESLIMTKERVVETLGELRYTIGSGCSGGSLVQQQLANAYPGLYQGILPQCSYPDAWSSAMQYEDYVLMLNYFRHPEKWGTGVVWEETSIAAVLGHPNIANPLSFSTVIPDSGEPSRSCPGVPADKVYDENTNPTGVRCTLYDYMVNVFGTLPDSTWAQVPWDNTGIQFGLTSLIAGRLSPQNFVDINTKIGGFDIDHNFIPERVEAYPFAAAAAYRSGAINQGNNLDEVAIIDLRGPDPGAFHDVYRTYAVRARLEREHGTAANQILWRGSVPLIGDVNYVSQGIVAIDAWLAAIEADDRTVPLAQKIIEDRPASVRHRCTNGAGVELPADVCDATVTSYTTPRIEAGMPFTDDVMVCQKKPMRRSDYYPAQFTDAQWTQLQAAFPDGVCDYSKPGHYQQDTIAWQTYQDAGGGVIYGGTPLGPEPRSTAF